MSQSGAATAQWLFQDTAKWEYQQDLEEERQKLAEEKRKFEKERTEFHWKKQIEEKRLAQEKQLFEMKWKILEKELQKVAKEKQEIELEREQYYSKASGNYFEGGTEQKVIKGELFFSGVRTESALKTRYRELIKIFHPDNAAGDTNTLQEINREYDCLKRAFEG